ncbi:MAG: endo-alpha-(1-_5)-L-arabinanase, partial [Clostridia bacterium]|nr:endo-alpha-(1->5)-L-arabinanase [Clostridia bacterium]
LASLNADGTITGAKKGAWTVTDGTNIHLTIDGKEYSARLHTAWDNNQQAWVTQFTGLDTEGAALWGVRYGE